MRLTNLTSRNILLNFIRPMGIALTGSSSVIVDDSYGSHPSIQDLVSDGILAVDTYEVDDSHVEATDDNPLRIITAGEFNAVIKGLYDVPSGGTAAWSSTGTPDASATHCILTGTTLGSTILVEDMRVLSFSVVGCATTIKVILEKGETTPAAIVTALNNNSTFADHLVASFASSKLVITTKAYGVGANVSMAANDADAQHLLGLSNATKTAATGAVATITFKTLGPTGEGISGVQHTVTLWNAASGGAPCTEHLLQNFDTEKGTVISGARSHQMVVKSGIDGIVELKVYAPSTVSAQCHMEITTPTYYILAQVPATRLVVVGP